MPFACRSHAPSLRVHASFQNRTDRPVAVVRLVPIHSTVSPTGKSTQSNSPMGPDREGKGRARSRLYFTSLPPTQYLRIGGEQLPSHTGHGPPGGDNVLSRTKGHLRGRREVFSRRPPWKNTQREGIQGREERGETVQLAAWCNLKIIQMRFHWRERDENSWRVYCLHARLGKAASGTLEEESAQRQGRVSRRRRPHMPKVHKVTTSYSPLSAAQVSRDSESAAV